MGPGPPAEGPPPPPWGPGPPAEGPGPPAPPWATAAAVGPGGGGNVTNDKLGKQTEKTKMKEIQKNQDSTCDLL